MNTIKNTQGRASNFSTLFADPVLIKVDKRGNYIVYNIPFVAERRRAVSASEF